MSDDKEALRSYWEKFAAERNWPALHSIADAEKRLGVKVKHRIYRGQVPVSKIANDGTNYITTPQLIDLLVGLQQVTLCCPSVQKKTAGGIKS